MAHSLCMLTWVTATCVGQGSSPTAIPSVTCIADPTAYIALLRCRIWASMRGSAKLLQKGKAHLLHHHKLHHHQGPQSRPQWLSTRVLLMLRLMLMPSLMSNDCWENYLCRRSCPSSRPNRPNQRNWPNQPNPRFR